MFIKILAQVLNALGTGINILGINNKKKNITLICFAIGNICVAASLGLLGAYSGLIIQIVFVIQTIINYFYEKKSDKYPLWLILLYVIVPSIILAFNFQSMWDICPLIGGIMYQLALVSKNFTLRALNLVSALVWIPYDLHFGQYVGAISCTVFSITDVIAIIRFDVLQKNKK